MKNHYDFDAWWQDFVILCEQQCGFTPCLNERPDWADYWEDGFTPEDALAADLTCWGGG